MPAQWRRRGFSWRLSPSPDASTVFSDRVLPYFKTFQDPTPALYKNAFGRKFPTTFASDAASGNLPQVSWLIPSAVNSEHPPSPGLFGEVTVSAVVNALTANPAMWAKTVLFVTYDENGGFFDHV